MSVNPRHWRPLSSYHLSNIDRCKRLVVAIAVVVVILEEEVLVCAVAGEGDAGDAEAGKDAAEALHAAEGAGVSPRLTGLG